jgi:hypothetical protein
MRRLWQERKEKAVRIEVWVDVTGLRPAQSCTPGKKHLLCAIPGPGRPSIQPTASARSPVIHHCRAG